MSLCINKYTHIQLFLYQKRLSIHLSSIFFHSKPKQFKIVVPNCLKGAELSLLSYTDGCI